MNVILDDVWQQRSRLGRDRAVTLHHHHALAEEGLALRRLKILHRGLAAVIRSDDTTIALTDEVDLVFGPRTEVTVLIDHLGGDKRRLLTLIILAQTDAVRCAAVINVVSLP